LTATPKSTARRKPSNSAATATIAKQLSADIIAALGPAGIISEYSSLGVRFAGDVRASGVIECYGALRDTDNDSKPSAYVDTTTGKYKDSGGTETREIELWEFIARKGRAGGDWLAAKKALAERLGLAGVGSTSKKSGRRSKAKQSPAAVQSSAPVTPTTTDNTNHTRKPRTAEDPATVLGFEDWTPGKERLLKWWCIKHRRGVSVESVLAAGGRIAKYPLGRTNNATGEPIDVATDYVVAVPVYGEPNADGLAGEGNVSATTATAMLAAGPTAYVIWKLNGKPFAIYRGKDEKGEPIYDAAKMKSIGSTDGVIGEHGLRVLAGHDITTAGSLTIFKPEGPTDLLALFTAQQSEVVRSSNPILAFAGTAKQANRWMVALFTGHTAVVVHDADRTGEAGVTKVCNLLSITNTAADVRNVKLPYDIAEKSGPDLRDWLNDGGTWGELENKVLWSESWKVGEGNGAEGSDTTDDDQSDNPQADGEAEPEFKPIEAGDDPHRLARDYVSRYATSGEQVTIRRWREEWHRWDGSQYREIGEAQMKDQMNWSIKEEFNRMNIIAQEIFADRDQSADDYDPNEAPPVARKVSRTLVADVNAALAGMYSLPSDTDAPFWISGAGPFPANEVFATGSGIIHLRSLLDGKPGYQIPSSPDFFSPNAVSYKFPDDDIMKCKPPEKWFAFLSSLWGDDEEMVQLLQEWMGYCLLPDTRQQKIMLLIGPPRSGKGTICRVLTDLVGELNVVNPRLSSFGTEFGIEPLIGKTLGIVSDARLSGRSDIAQIVETLLSISGEDKQTVRRMYKSHINTRLRLRFMIVSNELPALQDASGAFLNRCLLLQTNNSFLGKEDKELEAALRDELPGILVWAARGLFTLQERGYFKQPASSAQLFNELYALTSPIKAFLDDCCDIGNECSGLIDDVYTAYRNWSDEQGRRASIKQVFGRDLRAAMPQIKTEQLWNGGSRTRTFAGLKLKPEFMPPKNT